MAELDGFQSIPKDLRPRERLIQYGEEALSNHELLAILLRTGTKQMNVMELSMHILSQVGNLNGFRSVTYEELLELPGIGQAKAVALLSAIELGKRINRSTQIKEGTVTSSRWIGQLLIDEIGGLFQENVIAVYLNTKNEIIKKSIIFKGSLNSSVAHPREIFREAVKCSAARIIIGHNHPSGNPEPSEADYSFTKRLIEAGDIIGIHLLDHIIVGENEFISLKEEGFF